MDEQQIKLEGVDNVLGEKQTHPAFGMIRIGEATGQAVLVGSAVQHQHFVTLTIKEACRYRDEYHEKYFADKTICEIYLSHAQLAEMLFNHSGDGIPCTIKYATGDKEGHRPTPPYESPLKQQSDDLSSVLQKTLDRARDLASQAEQLIQTKTLKASDRDNMKFLAMKIVQDIESNLPYAMRCMDEKIEKNIAHAKAEIESFMSMKFKTAGIEHMKQESEKLLLPDSDQEGS